MHKYRAIPYSGDGWGLWDRTARKCVVFGTKKEMQVERDLRNGTSRTKPKEKP